MSAVGLLVSAVGCLRAISGVAGPRYRSAKADGLHTISACPHRAVWTSADAWIERGACMCVTIHRGMCIGVCVDLRVAMCADMCTCTCIGMCIGICIGM